MATDSIIRSLAAAPDTGATMPILFIGHGSPMNAIEDTDYSRAWAAVARSLPTPRAILCVSAHWQTAGTRVTAMEKPKTIHDFYGFPPALFEKRYPAPGSPELARMAQKIMREAHAELDLEWGLDHGAWAVLCQMYPKADVPEVQLSLDEGKPPAFHYELGRELRGLRKKGVLIIGSGNVVHNLREMAWEDTAFDWALEFDAKMKDLILTGDHQAIIDSSKLGRSACLAVPTLEHYLPLLYVLGAQDKGDSVGFFVDKVTLGSMSMRSVRLG
ncbi:MAG: 4,5-DOPA dioxygenase extradiol [Verrucomicrobia bacterium]|nr:4,5-DOPA dioxygenase extradiol [Verrucomicrobiota bacterium]